ncbi:putative N6-adenine methyltransferase-domain-containing protein [Pelagophyceae sp. CCMP2097]|nr:putative N6-adenine methyltransferase-domain-containing protein [Pelagophyceae sp. CCMP2097]
MASLDDVGDDSSSDGEPEIGLGALRPEALAALAAYRSEREVKESSGDHEDFGLSQFWYSDAFSDDVAAALRTARPTGRIAVVSCPSVHKALLRRDANDDSVLFEYDERLGARLRPEQFVRYDYNDEPWETAAREGGAAAGSYDFVVLDPPYVSEACVTRFWAFAAHLSAGAVKDSALFFTSVVNRNWLATKLASMGVRTRRKRAVSDGLVEGKGGLVEGKRAWRLDVKTC